MKPKCQCEVMRKLTLLILLFESLAPVFHGSVTFGKILACASLFSFINGSNIYITALMLSLNQGLVVLHVF